MSRRTIADDPVVRILSQPSILKWVLATSADWTVIVAMFVFAIWVPTWWAYVAAIFIIGVFQHRLALLVHEAAHRHISENALVNDWLGNLLCGWLIGVNLSGYRQFHFKHHLLVGTDRDPELVHRKNSAPTWDLPASRFRIFLLYLLDVSGIGFFYRNRRYWFAPLFPVEERASIAKLNEQFLLADNDRDKNFFLKYPQILFVILIAGIFWALNLAIVPVFWAIASVTSFRGSFYLRTWAEHIGTAGTHRIHPTWWQRSLFLPHNTAYHFEHHLWASIPSWNLPKSRELESTTPEVPGMGFFRRFSETLVIKSGDQPPLA